MRQIKNSTILSILFLFTSCFFLDSAAFAVLSGEKVTLQQAVKKALEHNPDLNAYEHNLEIAEGKIFQAGRTPNPQLSVEFEDFGGTGDLAGTGSLESSVADYSRSDMKK